MVRPVIALSLVALLTLGGCRSAFVGRAQAAYEEGRYLEVAESLAQRENELHTIGRAKQAQYGLYRALALLKLGDYDGAGQWLNFVDGIERAGLTLDPARRRLLAAGKAELTAMLNLRDHRSMSPQIDAVPPPALTPPNTDESTPPE